MHLAVRWNQPNGCLPTAVHSIAHRMSLSIPCYCYALCKMSFDHPATMPTIISPARIILPPPSIPDTQWHHGHPLLCPHPQSDVPDSHFSSHRHWTCNLPLLFRHLATIMPRGRTSTPIELKHTSIHCIYSTI